MYSELKQGRDECMVRTNVVCSSNGSSDVCTAIYRCLFQRETPLDTMQGRSKFEGAQYVHDPDVDGQVRAGKAEISA